MKKHKPKKKEELRREIARLQIGVEQLQRAARKLRPMYESKLYAVRIGKLAVPLMTSSVHIRDVVEPFQADHLDIVEMVTGKVVGVYDFGQEVNLKPGDSFDIQVDLQRSTLAAAPAKESEAERSYSDLDVEVTPDSDVKVVADQVINAINSQAQGMPGAVGGPGLDGPTGPLGPVGTSEPKTPACIGEARE